MSPDGSSQPLLTHPNGQQLSEISPLYTTMGLSSIDEDQLDLNQILTVARRRAVVIAGVAIAVSSGIAAKTLTQQQIHQGTFELLVEPVSGEDQLEQLSDSLGQAVPGGGETLDYETQIQVLTSPQVMSPIVEKIQTRYPEVDYKTLLEELTVSQLAETKILEVRYQDGDAEKIQFILEQIADGYISYSRIEQQTSIRQGIEFVNDQLPTLQDRVDRLQGELQIFRQNYNIVDPQTQGQLLTNRVGQLVQQRQETQAQLEETQALYTKLQGQLQELGVSPDRAMMAATLSEAPRYQALLDRFSQTESEIAELSAKFTDEHPRLQQLKTQRQNLLPLLEQESTNALGSSTSTLPSNPQTLASPNSIRLALTQQLIETTNLLKVLNERRSAITRSETLMSQELQQLAVIAREHTDLQRKLQIATESLNRFLAVRETLEIEAAQKTLPWQVIANPQLPEQPISPNIPRGLLLGAIAGVLAGAGAGMLAEKLDRVFHSTDELKNSTKLPILGTIPYRKDLKQEVASLAEDAASTAETQEIQLAGHSYSYHYTSSPFSEAFRSLHANLHFLSPDRPIRSVVISSSVPADGKSTTAAFLAQAAAAMGQRVLLVDADLRRPQVHVVTDLPNVWGLSNVISSEINAEDVIQRSSHEENLFVLTAGQIPPDPTRLLSSRKMKSLVEHFQEAFELVIFDTPPLLGLADARLLAAHTDGMVVVVGMGKTNQAVLKEVLYGLKTSNAPVLGLVANADKTHTAQTSEYYQRYYGRSERRQRLNAQMS